MAGVALAAATAAAYDARFALFQMNKPARGSLLGIEHLDAKDIQGLLNLVFFLYLIRPEVREKLR